MQKNSVAKLTIALLLSMSGSLWAQQQNPNKLAPCPKPDYSKSYDVGQGGRTERWTNCWGKYRVEVSKDHKGAVLEGEWLSGLLHGQGTYTYANNDKYVGEFKEGKRHGQGAHSFSNGDKYVGGYKDDKFHGQGIGTTADGKRFEGIWENGSFIREEKIVASNTASNDKKNRKTDISKFFEAFAGLAGNNEEDKEKLSKFSELVGVLADSSSPSGDQRKQEHQKTDSERQRIEEEKQRREQQRRGQRVNLAIAHTQPAPDGSLTINIQTNADTASLLVNGEEQGGRPDGTYVIKKIARVGQDTQFKITAVDINGNSETKTITVTRQAAPSSAQTATLKPETVKRAPVRDAVAIIIGIQNYKRVPKAEFADNDAKEFNEYAIRALGIKPEKIKILLDEEADEVNIVKAFENWLPIQVNKDKTDVYVFYSGHGLPSSDGKSLYFLPHGVDKELLSRTAVAQNEIVAALTAAKPKSVTMFIDACYSGQTREGDFLIANAKPLALKSDVNTYPANFTVITASANDQISSSSPELRHGIFSFYLMKGMEGDADANQDGKITVGEMQDYLSDKVARQATTLGRKQNTQVVGDSSRVLVGR